MLELGHYALYTMAFVLLLCGSGGGDVASVSRGR